MRDPLIAHEEARERAAMKVIDRQEAESEMERRLEMKADAELELRENADLDEDAEREEAETYAEDEGCELRMTEGDRRTPEERARDADFMQRALDWPYGPRRSADGKAATGYLPLKRRTADGFYEFGFLFFRSPPQIDVAPRVYRWGESPADPAAAVEYESFEALAEDWMVD